jgi:hypothetical protein
MRIIVKYWTYFLLCATYAYASIEEEMIAHVKWSLEQAETGVSHLDPKILEIDGMSSPKIRHFLNNLGAFPNVSYLEIGCWKGSTLISSLYGNQTVAAVAIDNWSEFGEPKEEFAANISQFLPPNQVLFINGDCFEINVKNTFSKRVNVYFYDGEHSYSNQYRAFSYFNSIFEDVFIAIVDDWNWERVQGGTRLAFHDLGYQVLYEKFFLTPRNGDTSSWWNGFYIAVLRKTL